MIFPFRRFLWFFFSVLICSGNVLADAGVSEGLYDGTDTGNREANSLEEGKGCVREEPAQVSRLLRELRSNEPGSRIAISEGCGSQDIILMGRSVVYNADGSRFGVVCYVANDVAELSYPIFLLGTEERPDGSFPVSKDLVYKIMMEGLKYLRKSGNE